MNKKLSKSLLLIVIVFIFSLISATNIHAQKSTLRFTIGDGVPKCDSNPSKCLKDEFNIIVSGNTYQSYLLDFYEILGEISRSSKYQQLLKSSGPTTLIFNTGSLNCAARVQPIGGGRSSMTFSNFNPSVCSRTTRKDSNNPAAHLSSLNML